MFARANRPRVARTLAASDARASDDARGARARTTARAARSTRREVLIGTGAGAIGAATRDARAATGARLADVGELGIGTWSWGNTAVWVRRVASRAR
jgi:hypothetical protein